MSAHAPPVKAPSTVAVEGPRSLIDIAPSSLVTPVVTPLSVEMTRGAALSLHRGRVGEMLPSGERSVARGKVVTVTVVVAAAAIEP